MGNTRNIVSMIWAIDSKISQRFVYYASVTKVTWPWYYTLLSHSRLFYKKIEILSL